MTIGKVSLCLLHKPLCLYPRDQQHLGEWQCTRRLLIVARKYLITPDIVLKASYDKLPAPFQAPAYRYIRQITHEALV